MRQVSQNLYLNRKIYGHFITYLHVRKSQCQGSFSVPYKILQAFMQFRDPDVT